MRIFSLPALAGWLFLASSLDGWAQTSASPAKEKLKNDRPSVRRYPDQMPKTVKYRQGEKVKVLHVKGLFEQPKHPEQGPVKRYKKARRGR